ncbi:MAG: hypothetical protein KJ970_19390 [Candidatus Eisenbacteria bacterium]|uniref:Lipoprotein n=1 Tax=Eiseniibacteriota bacterium TaxID=2212470 RepID=A0A948W8V5_UNCEI|nr:hypothetical protein [Candidatus Eisenbacteria bacterium]MBU1949877.1 hypothetical protein [Candidatus Eisenbacteria bacterium]MBU2693086.1 hypothetical protein [Candidatus Eisenbacteria bacterium]
MKAQIRCVATFSILAVLFTACSFTKVTPGRLYNLSTGDILLVELVPSCEGNGTIAGITAEGDSLIGEYTVHYGSGPVAPPHTIPWDTKNNQSALGIKESNGTYGNQTSWPEVYGYGQASKAKPVGTATLVSKRGLVVQIVMYSMAYGYSSGDGVARDNQGNWYRAHLGTLKR